MKTTVSRGVEGRVGGLGGGRGGEGGGWVGGWVCEEEMDGDGEGVGMCGGGRAFFFFAGDASSKNVRRREVWTRMRTNRNIDGGVCVWEGGGHDGANFIVWDTDLRQNVKRAIHRHTVVRVLCSYIMISITSFVYTKTAVVRPLCSFPCRLFVRMNMDDGIFRGEEP